jgi:hypothetical protein
VDGGPRQPLIDGLRVALALKHDVGGERDLIQALVVSGHEKTYFSGTAPVT